MKSNIVRLIITVSVLQICGSTILRADGPGPMPMCMPGQPCPDTATAVSDFPAWR
jgi:hypothetical protein